MAEAQFRFYAELNDFMSGESGEARREFVPGAKVKDLIEGFGVPHTEVDLIVANGESVGFDYAVRDGDRVSVFPVFESIDIASLTRVRAHPLRVPRFVLDGHLGRLARYRRMLGFDAVWEGNVEDAELARMALNEKRIVLTRDVGLLKRTAVERGYWIREINPRLQLKETLLRFDLAELIRPFTRCMRCNVPLRKADQDEIASAPADVADAFTDFQVCPGCRRLFWEGSHFRRMRSLIAELRGKQHSSENSCKHGL